MAVNNSNNFVGEVAQKAVIQKEGKVLLVRPPGAAFWDLPGGRIHSGEMPTEALTREIKEELGIDINVGQAFFADMWLPSKNEPASARYFVGFEATLQNPNADFIMQTEEVEEVKWITKEEVSALPLYEICKKALTTYFS